MKKYTWISTLVAIGVVMYLAVAYFYEPVPREYHKDYYEDDLLRLEELQCEYKLQQCDSICQSYEDIILQLTSELHMKDVIINQLRHR